MCDGGASGLSSLANLSETQCQLLLGELSRLVANTDFYQIDTRLGTPHIDQTTWSVRVHGMVDKEVTLTLTGTSKISTLSIETRGGKPVPVQRDADAKDVKPQQSIAVIYTQGAAGPVPAEMVCRFFTPSPPGRIP